MRERADASRVAVLFSDLIERAEFEPGAAAGRFSREALVHVRLDLLIEMKPHLLVEFSIDAARSEDGSKTVKEIAQHQSSVKRLPAGWKSAPARYV